MFFIGVFLLIVISAVLMLASVMTREGGTAPESVAPASPTSATARTALSRQLAHLERGDWEALRATFPEALRGHVTESAVREAAPLVAGKTVDDLVGSIRVAESEEGHEAVVLGPSGSELTRMVWTDGVWLVDRLWFVPR